MPFLVQQAIQKHVAGQIWPEGCRLPIPGLKYHLKHPVMCPMSLSGTLSLHLPWRYALTSLTFGLTLRRIFACAILFFFFFCDSARTRTSAWAIPATYKTLPSHLHLVNFSSALSSLPPGTCSEPADKSNPPCHHSHNASPLEPPLLLVSVPLFM